MNNQRKFNGGWLAIILVVLLFLGLVILAYLLSARVVALKQTEKNILIFTAKKNNFDSLQKLALTLSGDRQVIENYFVTNETLPGFIERLEKLASSTEVAFNITDVALTTGANPVMRLNFTARASFPRLFRFISLVDSLPYVLDLTQASFVREGGKGGAWNGTFNLDLITTTAT